MTSLSNQRRINSLYTLLETIKIKFFSNLEGLKSVCYKNHVTNFIAIELNYENLSSAEQKKFHREEKNRN